MNTIKNPNFDKDTVFVTDSFVDYAGDTHKFVVAGTILTFKDEAEFNVYSNDPEYLYDENGFIIFDEDKNPIFVEDCECIAPIHKAISIGISICAPCDEFNEIRGKLQAEGRAFKKCDRVIAFSKGGMCSKETVEFFVNTTVKNLKSDPGLFIKGYNKAKANYHELPF